MYANGARLIDWLSMTQFWVEAPLGVQPHDAFSVAAWAAPMCVGWTYSDVKLRGYNRAIVSDEGVIVAFNDRAGSGTPEMDKGIHTQFSGKALNTLGVFGITDMELLRWAWVERDARITRIDIAVDASVPVDFEAMSESVQSKTAKTLASTMSFVRSRTGTTVYVGHRSSEKFLRVYDKAGEQGTKESEGEWTRAELVLKGKSAISVVERLLADGKDVIPAIIRGYCDFDDVGGWDELLGGLEAVKVKRPVRESDTEKWLLESVTKTLAKRSLETEGLIEAFIARLNEELDELLAYQD